MFLERGMQATAEEVAARAGVSEGTIFHHFKSKDALFRAAMRFDPEAVPSFVESLTTAHGGAELKTQLVDFANRMLALGRTAVPMMMMSWSNPTGEYRLETLLARSEGYRRTFRAVVGFFTREFAGLGLAAERCELLARIFLGSLHQYCMSELFGVFDRTGLSSQEFTEGLVDVLLGAAGCAPRGPSTPAPRPHAKAASRSKKATRGIGRER